MRLFISEGMSRQVFFYLDKIDKNQPVLIIEDNNKTEEIPLSDFKNHISYSSAQTKHNIVSANLPDSSLRLSLGWSEIVLTDKENYVIEALQIIDKDIQRLAFIDETSAIKKPL